PNTATENWKVLTSLSPGLWAQVLQKHFRRIRKAWKHHYDWAPRHKRLISFCAKSRCIGATRHLWPHRLILEQSSSLWSFWRYFSFAAGCNGGWFTVLFWHYFYSGEKISADLRSFLLNMFRFTINSGPFLPYRLLLN